MRLRQHGQKGTCPPRLCAWVWGGCVTMTLVIRLCSRLYSHLNFKFQSSISSWQRTSWRAEEVSESCGDALGED